MKKINLYLMMALIVGSVTQSSDYDQNESTHRVNSYYYDQMHSDLVKCIDKVEHDRKCLSVTSLYAIVIGSIMNNEPQARADFFRFITENAKALSEFTKSELAIITEGAAQTSTWKNIENLVSVSSDKVVDFVNENQLATGLALGAVSVGVLMKYACDGYLFSDNGLEQEAQYVYCDEDLYDFHADHWYAISNYYDADSFEKFKEIYRVV